MNNLQMKPTFCVRVFAFFCLACDDECSGLLISDMDRLYRIITEVTLTTPLPPPYKMLYRFENMTEGLKVKSQPCLVGKKKNSYALTCHKQRKCHYF